MTEQEKAIALKVAKELALNDHDYGFLDEDYIAYAAAFLEAIRAESEPVAWEHPDGRNAMHAKEFKTQPKWILDDWKKGIPLYTTPTIPPHLALVPREPTKEMLSAGRTADHEWQEIDTPDEVYEGGLASIYKAMLAAGEVK